MLKRIPAVAVLATMLLVAIAAPATGRGQAVERPFRGTWTGQTTDPSGVDCPPWAFPGRSIATGHATHLGRFTLIAEGCVEFIGGEFVNTGTAFYTAANGDELHIQFSGTLQFNDDGTTTLIAPATGISGTGRFANVVAVEGADTVTGFPDGTGRGVLDGRLIFNASDRSLPYPH